MWDPSAEDPTVLRIPVLRIPVLRIPLLRIPVLRIPVLRIPVLRIPVLRILSPHLAIWIGLFSQDSVGDELLQPLAGEGCKTCVAGEERVGGSAGGWVGG